MVVFVIVTVSSATTLSPRWSGPCPLANTNTEEEPGLYSSTITVFRPLRGSSCRAALYKDARGRGPRGQQPLDFSMRFGDHGPASRDRGGGGTPGVRAKGVITDGIWPAGGRDSRKVRPASKGIATITTFSFFFSMFICRKVRPASKGIATPWFQNADYNTCAGR